MMALYQAREDLSVLAWNAVQRITPEVAAQEPQSIAEMIAHLEGVRANLIEGEAK